MQLIADHWDGFGDYPIYDLKSNKLMTDFINSYTFTGSVRNDGLEDREIDKHSSLTDTVAMVKSFQIGK